MSSKCEFMDHCEFIGVLQQEAPEAFSACREVYCEGDFQHCARYMIAKAFSPESVPPGLPPGQGQRVRQMLEQLGQPTA